MKVTAESTEKLVTLIGNLKGEVPARIWKAKTEAGIECFLFVTRVMVKEGQDLSQFERELDQQTAPTPEVEAIPLRLIL